MNEIKGRIHSLESFGAVDGPGIRFVVFFQGCPLRCIFCHNPDTWDFSQGTEMTVPELVEKIKPFRPFLKKGGVTLTGGEPLAQPAFAAALLKALKAEGFHTHAGSGLTYPSLFAERRCSWRICCCWTLRLGSLSNVRRCAAATADMPKSCWIIAKNKANRFG